MVRHNLLLSMAAGLFLTVPATIQAQESAADTAPNAPKFSVETTPIGDIIDNFEAKLILDRHLPSLSANPQIDMARGMTLRQAQGYAPDQVPEDALKKIEADFIALGK